VALLNSGFNLLEPWRARPPTQFLVTLPFAFRLAQSFPRSLWVALNRLRTGVGHFVICTYCWGTLDTLKCMCGAEEQSAIHAMLDCGILRPPNCLEDLQSPYINNTKWLEDLVDFV